jgi:hypothetical protein
MFLLVFSEYLSEVFVVSLPAIISNKVRNDGLSNTMLLCDYIAKIGAWIETAWFMDYEIYNKQRIHVSLNWLRRLSSSEGAAVLKSCSVPNISHYTVLNHAQKEIFGIHSTFVIFAADFTE